MKKCFRRGITALLISTMLASTTTVAYASEIENQSLIETEKNADQVTLTDPSSDAAVLEDDGENYQGDLSENVNSQSSHDVQQNQDDSISASDGTLTGDNAPLQNSENQPESNTSQEENEETDAPVEEQHEGWVDTEEGKKYYVANTYVIGEKYIDGFWYYFDDNGVMATGWTVQAERPNQQYYYDNDGKMHYGWLSLDSKKYYFHPVLGIMLRQCERRIENKWYYFDSDGIMAIGWSQHHGHTYYYNEDGSMYYGEKYIEGHWYYFHPVRGIMMAGWTKHHNHTYYYNEDGSMYYGEKYINGHWYYFHERTGVMATGWSKHHGHTYYYNSDGTMYYGERRINGSWYFFKDRIGVMATGWTKHHNHTYYYATDGKMCYGLQMIDGIRYYFHPVTGIYQWKNRKYQNPSQYYQIQESQIQLSGGGYNLNIGYEGIKTAWVIRALNLGNGVGMGGAEYTRRVYNAVKNFQNRHGLSVTGVTDLATWKAMGYSESDWYSLGAYVSPMKVDIYSSRNDCIEAMISIAYDYLGDDYMIGASGAPGLGIDCSGLVMQALYAAGIDMSPINPVRHASPGYEYESANIWRSSKLKHVSYSERKRGDIIIYCNSSGVVIHSAIYLGNNKVIEAWPNKVVVASMINNQHPRVLGVVRPFV